MCLVYFWNGILSAYKECCGAVENRFWKFTFFNHKLFGQPKNKIDRGVVKLHLGNAKPDPAHPHSQCAAHATGMHVSQACSLALTVTGARLKKLPSGTSVPITCSRGVWRGESCCLRSWKILDFLYYLCNLVNTF